MTYRRRQLVALRQALDEARFGAERTLNLRALLPSAADAVVRTEAWLRERQVQNSGDVLIITGRGNQSPDGVSVVRAAVAKLLASLKRRGVVARVQEHTAGSFIVTLAPMRALWEAPRRRGERRPAPRPDPPALSALAPETREALRALATLSLDTLGVRDSEQFVESEMVKQFSALSLGLPEGPQRETRLLDAIRRAIDEYQNR
jgi:hypothetical protein